MIKEIKNRSYSDVLIIICYIKIHCATLYNIVLKAYFNNKKFKKYITFYKSFFIKQVKPNEVIYTLGWESLSLEILLNGVLEYYCIYPDIIYCTYKEYKKYLYKLRFFGDYYTLYKTYFSNVKQTNISIASIENNFLSEIKKMYESNEFLCNPNLAVTYNPILKKIALDKINKHKGSYKSLKSNLELVNNNTKYVKRGIKKTNKNSRLKLSNKELISKILKTKNQLNLSATKYFLKNIKNSKKSSYYISKNFVNNIKKSFKNTINEFKEFKSCLTINNKDNYELNKHTSEVSELKLLFNQRYEIKTKVNDTNNKNKVLSNNKSLLNNINNTNNLSKYKIYRYAYISDLHPFDNVFLNCFKSKTYTLVNKEKKSIMISIDQNKLDKDFKKIKKLINKYINNNIKILNNSLLFKNSLYTLDIYSNYYYIHTIEKFRLGTIFKIGCSNTLEDKSKYCNYNVSELILDKHIEKFKYIYIVKQGEFKLLMKSTLAKLEDYLTILLNKICENSYTFNFNKLNRQKNSKMHNSFKSDINQDSYIYYLNIKNNFYSIKSNSIFNSDIIQDIIYNKLIDYNLLILKPSNIIGLFEYYNKLNLDIFYIECKSKEGELYKINANLFNKFYLEKYDLNFNCINEMNENNQNNKKSIDKHINDSKEFKYSKYQSVYNNEMVVSCNIFKYSELCFNTNVFENNEKRLNNNVVSYINNYNIFLFDRLYNIYKYELNRLINIANSKENNLILYNIPNKYSKYIYNKENIYESKTNNFNNINNNSNNYNKFNLAYSINNLIKDKNISNSYKRDVLKNTLSSSKIINKLNNTQTILSYNIKSNYSNNTNIFYKEKYIDIKHKNSCSIKLNCLNNSTINSCETNILSSVDILKNSINLSKHNRLSCYDMSYSCNNNNINNDINSNSSILNLNNNKVLNSIEHRNSSYNNILYNLDILNKKELSKVYKYEYTKDKYLNKSNANYDLEENFIKLNNSNKIKNNSINIKKNSTLKTVKIKQDNLVFNKNQENIFKKHLSESILDRNNYKLNSKYNNNKIYKIKVNNLNEFNKKYKPKNILFKNTDLKSNFIKIINYNKDKNAN